MQQDDFLRRRKSEVSAEAYGFSRQAQAVRYRDVIAEVCGLADESDVLSSEDPEIVAETMPFRLAQQPAEVPEIEAEPRTLRR